MPVSALSARLLACAGALAFACGAPSPPLPDPIVPATHRDPPTHLPAPIGHGETGGPVSLAASAGEEQAREMLVALVIALRDQDAESLASLLAPAVFFSATLRGGRAPASVSSTALTQQLLAAARIAQARRDARFEDLVDPGSIRVAPIAAAFPGALPPELEPGDRIVSFSPTASGRRLLAALAQESRVSLVIRSGQGARIVAR